MICTSRRQYLSLALTGTITLGLILGLALVGHCAPAVDGQASKLTDLSLEDLMNVTVVTAGKKAESSSKTAAAVFVITHDDIVRYGYRTLGQALKRISGFYTEYDYAYDYVGVRGYLPNTDLNRRVLVLVDGHKVNDYLYGQAPVNNDLPVDMRDLERIEVVKGPGSALWGSEALLCVINCITRSASQMSGLQVGQDFGLRDGQRLTFGGSYSGGLQITGSLQDETSDGRKSIFFPDFNDPSTNNGMSVGRDGETVGRGWMKMVYQGLKFSYMHDSRVKDLPTASWGAIFNQPGLSLGDERHIAELSYENTKPLAGNGDLFCRVYQDNYDAVGYFNWWDSGLVTDRGIDRCRAHGAEARYSRDLTSRLSLILGSEYVRNYESSRTNSILSPNPRVRWQHSGDFSMISYYSQAEWNVAHSLRFVAGTRYDKHSIFGGNWNPRLAAIWERSPRTTFKMLYGEAERMPSLDEYMLAHAGTVLKPEKIITNEFVWDQQMSANTHLVTSIYGLKMYDLIDQPMDGVTSKGVETQFEYRLHNGGSGYLGLSHSDAKSTTADFTLPSSPQWLLTTGVSLPVFGQKAYLATDMQFVSQSGTNMGNVAGAYAVANMTLTSSNLVKNLDISIGVTNLFNTPFVVNARPEDVQDVMPEPDRQLQLQVSYNH